MIFIFLLWVASKKCWATITALWHSTRVTSQQAVICQLGYNSSKEKGFKLFFFLPHSSQHETKELHIVYSKQPHDFAVNELTDSMDIWDTAGGATHADRQHNYTYGHILFILCKKVILQQPTKFKTFLCVRVCVYVCVVLHHQTHQK